MKNKFTVAIPPEGCKDWFTPGKEYKILKWVKDDAFHVMSDTGMVDYCLVTNCCHLRGGNWTLK